MYLHCVSRTQLYRERALTIKCQHNNMLYYIIMSKTFYKNGKRGHGSIQRSGNCRFRILKKNT